MVLDEKPGVVPCCGAFQMVFVQLLVQFLFFDVQEFNLLVESVSCCCPYGVVALPVVAVYFNVYVVGRQLLISASLVKPDGCVRFVQLSFDVLIGVYFCGLFDIYKFNIHGTVHRSMTSSNNQRDAAQ